MKRKWNRNMKKLNGKSIWLNVTFWIMLVFCIILSVTNDSKDIISFFVNITLFVVVFIIFRNANKKFRLVQEIINDLRSAIERIESEYEKKKCLLWDTYKDIDAQELFKNKVLIKFYGRYLNERKRLAQKSQESYKCGLSDFINENLIDMVIKKNVLNLIPGVMTGLGILGTFVGLSIGLHNFNTGNSAEIASSIAPLMNGIKVAFHTSIYGMSFSLIFNYIYKQQLEEAYSIVDEFLLVFNSCVDSDADADNESYIQRMLHNMPEVMSEKVSAIISPTIDKMNDTLENLTRNIANSQVEGVAEVVDQFIKAMNTSMGESFENLGETINKTCELQKTNAELITNVFEKTKEMTCNIETINELTEKNIANMSSYVEKIERMQGDINEGFDIINGHLEKEMEYDEKLKQYIDILVSYERQIGEASNRFTKDMSKQLEFLSEMENKISESTRENLEMLSQKADDYNKTLTDVAKQQIQAVLAMTTEYSEKITQQLNDLGNMHERISEETLDNLRVLSEKADSYNKSLADHAKGYIESIIALSDEKVGDMDRASSELAKVTRDINDKITVSLNNAFQVIDQNLAEITQHLSGTILEIDSTTERVPYIVKTSYDGMKLSFDEMQKQYENLMNSLKLMVENIENINHKIEVK